MHEAYLSLGSNQGDRRAIILSAIQLIGERIGTVVRQSSLIETEPWRFSSPNRFLNAAVCCETTLTPRQLLLATQRIERDLGRKEKSQAENGKTPVYKDRPIDIDILLYDDWSVNEPGLTIPHPLMYQRDFVMTPLNQILKK